MSVLECGILVTVSFCKVMIKYGNHVCISAYYLETLPFIRRIFIFFLGIRKKFGKFA